jgi:putative ABC transport system permease protein
LIAGENFGIHAATDSIRPIILNENAIKTFGWKDPETAIGKPFKMGGQQGKVIGVVKDFHFNTLQHLISPLAIYLTEEIFEDHIESRCFKYPTN